MPPIPDRLLEWTHFLYNLHPTFVPTPETTRQWLTDMQGAPALGDAAHIQRSEKVSSEGLVWERDGRACGGDALTQGVAIVAAGPGITFDVFAEHVLVAATRFNELSPVTEAMGYQHNLAVRIEMPFTGNIYSAMAQAFLGGSTVGAFAQDDTWLGVTLGVGALTEGDFPYQWLIKTGANLSTDAILGDRTERPENRVQLEFMVERDANQNRGAPFTEDLEGIVRLVRDLLDSKWRDAFILPLAPPDE